MPPVPPQSPASRPTAGAAADPGPDLCLLDGERCHYSVCLPGRMAEAAPALTELAARLKTILQSATRGTVTVTPERAVRSLFLLIDLDPHRAAAPAEAYALQQQGDDILISGKNARAVAWGVAQLLRETGFRVAADGRVTPPTGAPGVAVVWHAHDSIQLAPTGDAGWLAALGTAG